MVKPLAAHCLMYRLVTVYCDKTKVLQKQMLWIHKYCVHILIYNIPRQHMFLVSFVTHNIPLQAGTWMDMPCPCFSIWLFPSGVFGAGSAKGISFFNTDSVSTFSLFACFFDATFLVTGVDSVNSVLSSWASCLECCQRCNKKKTFLIVFWSHSGKLLTRKF